MPAIQPARLKKQAVDLAALYGNPPAFVRLLHALLDRYSDYTHRSGQAGEPFTLEKAYNTPPQVMRQVWLELSREIRLHPECLLPLCDTLWAEPNYDLRLLAARLLGQVPVAQPRPVIERMHRWVSAGLDKGLLDGLLEYGLEQLRERTPAQVLDLAAGWLASPDLSIKQAGLRACLPLINADAPDNLPPIFKLITPYLRTAPARLRPDILALLAALAHVSPSETAYILHQSLSAPDNPDTAWLIRHVLDEFPMEMRAGLKAATKEIKK